MSPALYYAPPPLMELPPKLPPKKDVLIAFLAESSVFIHLDPRRDGVLVPKWFQKQADLVLQIGLNMPIPIMDLEVGDTGVSCTLSFSRSPFWCHIPWHAIFALRAQKDHRGMVWPDDVPHDSELLRGSSPPASPPARPRPRLQAVSNEPPKAASAKKMSEEERIARGLEPEDVDDGATESVPPPSERVQETKIRESLRAVPAPAPSEPAAAPASPGPDAPKPDAASPAASPAAAPPAAVPPAAVPPAAASPASATPADSPPRTDAAEGEAPAPASEPGGGAKKGKRQLPPYLRVVK